jgi:oligopeptide/dipeptide ABC transporter ATP-binding protein
MVGTDAGDALLRTTNLSITYSSVSGNVKALRDVSFEIGPREFVALVGESGAGKSTLALAIIGLLNNAKVEGDIFYRGKDLSTLSKREWNRYRGSEIGMIFQEPLSSLNPIEKVGKQMAEAIQIGRNREGMKRELRIHNYSATGLVSSMATSDGLASKIVPNLPSSAKTPQPGSVRAEVLEWLRKVRIPDPESVADRYPFQLSGGMVQRAMIAMALSESPALLIADEPTTALDVTTQAQILKLMKGLIETQNTSIIIVTHDLGVAAQVADRIVVMYGGEVVEDGSTKQIFHNPLHPYTKGLLKCYPSATKAKQKLETIPGTMPDLRKDVVGCAFADRCNLAEESCRVSKPPYIQAEQGHYVKCVLYN